MGWVLNAMPRLLYPLETDPMPLYRRLGWPQGQSGRVGITSPPPGFDPRIVQPVANLYTDGAIQAHLNV